MRLLDEVAKRPGVKCIERGEDGGAYRVQFREVFTVVASYGGGWDHVSVSLVYRTPKWDEMEHIKRIFFEDDEWAMQLHAPPSKHLSIHPYTLHIWRPHDHTIPIPHPLMV